MAQPSSNRNQQRRGYQRNHPHQQQGRGRQDQPRQSREERRDIRHTGAQYVLDLQKYAINPKAEADGGWDVIFLGKDAPLYKKWGKTLETHVAHRLEFLRKNEQTLYGVLATWGMRSEQLDVVVRIFNLSSRDEHNLRLYCFGLGLIARALRVKQAFSKGYGVKLLRQLRPAQVAVLKEKIREEFSYIADDEQGEESDDLLEIVDELDSIMDEDPGDKFVRWLLPDDEDPFPSTGGENGAKPAADAKPGDDLFEDGAAEDGTDGTSADDLLVEEEDEADLLGGDGGTLKDDGDLLGEGVAESKPKANPELEAAITFVHQHAAKDPKKAKGVATAQKLLRQMEKGIADATDFIKQVAICKKVAGVK